ncbi:hypothetical protein HEK616_40450 [Streptomyces nigrescens]|uniref:Uncharacterized protein n=1 Tax=Streptomyces nigrescens TaxID=1920 RepID=A0ABM7ZW09_STRNI|nr:hypothetical protein [Streptomyces nigrescens]BDM70558.1 hypothetical protein HEK616_40450 [Streptomyces nigrescens]
MVTVPFSELNGDGIMRALRKERQRKEAEAKAQRTAEAQRKREAEAKALRERAEACESSREESFRRCDNDGFLTQWAAGVSAQAYSLDADIVAQGGKWEFPALFDLEGTLVPARRERGQYGWYWELLNERGRRIGWFNESKAKNPETRRRNNAKKGYYVGTVRVPAEAGVRNTEPGTNWIATVPVRKDGGWSPDAEIVDNGQ